MKITRWLFLGLSVVCAAGLARCAEAQTHDWCSEGATIHHFNFAGGSYEFRTDTGNGITPCGLTPNLSPKILGSPSGLASIPSAAGSQGLPSGSSGISFSNDISEAWWVGTTNLVQYDGGGCYDPYADLCGIEQYTELGGSGTYYPAFGGAGTIAFRIAGGDNHYGFGVSGEGRSTDIDGDGDTDEADEAAMRTAIQNQSTDTRYDLNFLNDGATDADLQILLEEARRRNGSNRYLRGHCTSEEGHLPCPSYMNPTYSGQLDIVAPATPSNMTAAVVCGGNWKVQWVAGGDDGQLGIAYRYDIRTSTLPITLENPAPAGSVNFYDTANATPLTAPLPIASGFTQSILYPTSTTGRYFAIRARDDTDEPSTGIATVFAPGLAELVAPATTSGVTATRISGGGSGGQARIRWTSAGDDGTTGTPATYDLRYSEAPISSANFNGAIGITPPAAAPAGTLMQVLFPMDACEQYYFALRTIDDQGNCSGVSNSPTSTGSCQQGGLLAGDDTDRPQVPTRLSLAVHTVTSEAVEFALSIPAEFAGTSQLVIHDVLGRRIATPLSASLSAGERTVRWDLRTDDGRRVPIGVYAARWVIASESRKVKFSVVR